MAVRYRLRSLIHQVFGDDAYQRWQTLVPSHDESRCIRVDHMRRVQKVVRMQSQIVGLGMGFRCKS